jgi:RNA polymerase primary sigma factor
MEDTEVEQPDLQLDFHRSLSIETERCLARLTERERDVLKLAFGIGTAHPVTLSDIGDMFGLTRERVRQIRDKALTKLRKHYGSSRLTEYLGQ